MCCEEAAKLNKRGKEGGIPGRHQAMAEQP